MKENKEISQIQGYKLCLIEAHHEQKDDCRLLYSNMEYFEQTKELFFLFQFAKLLDEVC